MKLASIIVALATNAAAISHGHIAHVNWDDLTSTGQQDAADALAKVSTHQTDVDAASTAYTVAMNTDNSAIITENKCQLLHE